MRDKNDKWFRKAAHKVAVGSDARTQSHTAHQEQKKYIGYTAKTMEKAAVQNEKHRFRNEGESLPVHSSPTILLQDSYTAAAAAAAAAVTQRLLTT